MINGSDRILYFKIEGNWLPISCLVSNGFSENATTLETTTRDNKSFKTTRPTNQSYSISFDGLLENSGTLNLNTIKAIKRNRQKIEWKLDDGETDYTYGEGYLIEISDFATVNEFISFSAVLQGVLKPNINNTDIRLYGVSYSRSRYLSTLYVGAEPGDRLLSGQILTDSIYSATLDGGLATLAGSIVGDSDYTATASVTMSISGSINGSSVYVGNTSVAAEISGSIVGSSVYSGSIADMHRMIGEIKGRSYYSPIVWRSLYEGTLTNNKEAEGVISGASDYESTLSKKLPLLIEGGYNGQTWHNGDLTLVAYDPFTMSILSESTDFDACFALIPNVTRYHNGTGDYPILGDRVFTSATGGVYNGNNLWYKMANNRAIQIDTNGYVVDYYVC